MIKCETLAIIEEISRQIVGVSASPGFTWGKGGSAGPGEYLYNDNVESNKSGRLVPFNGNVVYFFVNNQQNSGPRTLELRRRRPCQTGSWVTISSITLPAGDFCGAFPIVATVLLEDELSVRVATTSNDFENPIVGVIIRN